MPKRRHKTNRFCMQVASLPSYLPSHITSKPFSRKQRPVLTQEALTSVRSLHFRLIKLSCHSKMSNNNPFNLPIPTGSNNNSNKKRKQRTYLSAADDTTMSKKRQNTLLPDSTPVVPPAQPNFGYGTPQVANPPAYAPQSIPFAGAPPGYPPGYPLSTFGSTSFSPQYPQFQAQTPWPQQQPPPQQQHVPQPGPFYPGYHVQPSPAFSNVGLSAGHQHQQQHQQQVMPRPPRDVQRSQGPSQRGLDKKTEVLGSEEIAVHNLNAAGIPADITVKGRRGKTNFVAQTADPHMTISSTQGAKGYRVNRDQYAFHAGLYGGEGRQVTIMRTMPPMSDDMPPVVQTLQASTSTAGLSTANRGPQRQRPGTNPAQPPAQPPARPPARPPAQDQGPPPGQCQDLGRCPNCDKPGHLVGDCVGPPNRVHGDVPACSICNTFGGRDKDGNQLDGHRFDGCERISMLLDKYRWDKNRRIPYKDLASLTNDELHIIFDALVVRRLRKAPIRTKLFCWIDVLRETARRGDSSKVAAHLGYMTPWTKAFAIQQHNMPKRPWDDFDYAARDLSKLPLGPVEQVEGKWEDLVANGLQFPPQVYDSGDRQRLAENLDVKPEVRNRREEGRNHIAN